MLSETNNQGYVTHHCSNGTVFFLEREKLTNTMWGVAVPQSHITCNPGIFPCFFNGSFQCISFKCFNVVSWIMVVVNVLVTVMELVGYQISSIYVLISTISLLSTPIIHNFFEYHNISQFCPGKVPGLSLSPPQRHSETEPATGEGSGVSSFGYVVGEIWDSYANCFSRFDSAMTCDFLLKNAHTMFFWDFSQHPIKNQTTLTNKPKNPRVPGFNIPLFTCSIFNLVCSLKLCKTHHRWYDFHPPRNHMPHT